MRHEVCNATLAVAAVSAALLCSGRASAQEQLGQAGGFAIGAERVTGFASTDTEGELESGGLTLDIDGKTTSFSLLASDPRTPFASPRVGFDYFVIDGLSIGGFVAYISTDAELEVENVSTDEEKTTVFAFGPRVGYAYMFSDVVGIWPRGGFTYLSSETEDANDDETQFSLFAFSAEAMLVVAPVPHAAFIFGPTLDFTIDGGGEFNPDVGPSTDIDDVKVNTFGVQAGIVAWF